MRESFTPGVIASQIRLLRTQFKGSILIVEGPTDKKLFAKFTDRDACSIQVGYGQANVISIIQILEKDGFEGRVGIIDADFHAVFGAPATSPNLIYTDTHDIETMMLASPALNNLLTEYGSAEKIAQFEQKHSATVLEVISLCGIDLGYLRLLSISSNISLKFENIDYGSFINRHNLTINRQRMIQEVKNKSQAHHVSDDGLLNGIESLRSAEYHPLQICCGHDLIQILALALRSALGTRSANETNAELLELGLRLAFEYAHFQTTRLYSQIREWEARNTPFEVLRRAPP